MTEPAPTNTDTSNTEGGNSTGAPTPGASDEFKAPTSQAELDRIIGERLSRERGKYADYDDLKTKAAEFDKLADANKSEIEKANEKASKAEAEIAKVPTLVADGLKAHLVKVHEINDDDAELFLTATEPELLLKQVTRLLDRSAEGETDRKRRGPLVPREGRTTTPAPGDQERRAFVRGLTGRD